MEHIATMYQLVIEIVSNCGLDYVFVADTNLTLVECVISSIDWIVENQPEVIATCEAMP